MPGTRRARWFGAAVLPLLLACGVPKGRHMSAHFESPPDQFNVPVIVMSPVPVSVPPLNTNAPFVFKVPMPLRVRVLAGMLRVWVPLAAPTVMLAIVAFTSTVTG